MLGSHFYYSKDHLIITEYEGQFHYSTINPTIPGQLAELVVRDYLGKASECFFNTILKRQCCYFPIKGTNNC